jgi:hypothetical protein
MTAQEASEQATADVQTTSSEEGQESFAPIATGSVAPKQATDIPQESPEEESVESKPAVPEKLDPKDKRKSDKEWQEMKEKAKEADDTRARLEALERTNARLKFERDNPLALEHQEALDKLDADPRWKEISWEERLQFVSKTDASRVSRDMQEQAAASRGSVAPSSSTTPKKQEITEEQIKEGAAWFGSEEKARALHQKYFGS